jgi:glucose-6-phosphate isomerase
MLTLDFTNIMSESIGEDCGLTSEDINSLRDKIKEIHFEILQRRPKELYFLDLPDQNTEEIRSLAEDIRNNSEFFLLLGIGGSALGPKALFEALKPFYNLKGSPKIFIYDNVDPATLQSILSMINLQKTTVNVITKSGSTLETISSFLILLNALKKVHSKELSKWIIATTNPEKGILREIAIKEGLRTLPIHPQIVGRFSVLSPVGLLLSAVSGINIKAVLKGAKDLSMRCNEENIWKNPAYMYGALMYLMNQKKGKNISVLIPYSDRLKTFSEWYCQLWAESLGKNNQGQTPYPSVGTTDQHSQLQLWMEGPADKVITFIRIENYGTDISILPEDIESLGYLKNHTLGQLINLEQEATELALLKAGRPNLRINIPIIDGYYMGQLFMFFELATVVAGMLYGVNTFNQPGVEEGKNLVYGVMGRKGYESKRKEVEIYREVIRESRYRI